MGVKNGSKSAHFCSFLLKTSALLLISYHFMLIFYPIFLAYFNQALQSDMPTAIFRLKKRLALKSPSNFPPKQNFSKKSSQKMLQK